MLKRLAAVVFLIALASPATFAQNKKNQPNERSVSGAVTDVSGAPLKGAVVQLENTKTLQIRSFITKEKGDYFFSDLSTDVDYRLHAENHGMTSSTKVLSSFDSRKAATMNLKVDQQMK